MLFVDKWLVSMRNNKQTPVKVEKYKIRNQKVFAIWAQNAEQKERKCSFLFIDCMKIGIWNKIKWMKGP